jgi:peptidyl-prolyl cis-trans isomerase A (cyclophilin A)
MTLNARKVTNMNPKALLIFCSLVSGLVLAQESAQPAPPEQSQPAEPQPAPPAPVPTLVNVVIHTAMGDIAVALEKDRAPITVKNFLHYVDTKRFDGVNFYRAVAIGDEGKYGMLQGGPRADPKKVFAPIAHEAPAVTGLSHVDGAISMARLAPGTAKGEFFIVMGNLTALDGKPDGSDPGYAVFGHVTSGMDVVHQIMGLPRDPIAGKESGMQGQMLAQPVKILSVRRTD